jgi:hypothetical protein
MGVTTLDLYRSGNASGAQLDKVRLSPPALDPDIDHVTDSHGNVVVKSGDGGISSSETISALWTGKPWWLPVGAIYPDELELYPDGDGHWLWRPANDMALARYVHALQVVNRQFKPVGAKP